MIAFDVKPEVKINHGKATILFHITTMRRDLLSLSGYCHTRSLHSSESIADFLVVDFSVPKNSGDLRLIGSSAFLPTYQ